jgi:hypothetical protein
VNIRGIGWGVTDWIDLAQDRDQRRALVKMAMNFRVPQHVGIFLSSWVLRQFSLKGSVPWSKSVICDCVVGEDYTSQAKLTNLRRQTREQICLKLYV